MKYILFLIASAFIIILTGCGDESVISNRPGYQWLNGKIENWYLGSGNKLITCIVSNVGGSMQQYGMDTTQISPTGDFSIYLRKPENVYLMNLDFNDSSCTHNIKVNANDVKYIYLRFLVYNNNGHLGSIIYSSDTLETHEGSVDCEYFYYNKDCTIMGTDTCIYRAEFIFIKSYNLNVSTGWNLEYDKYIEQNGNELIMTVSKQQEPVKWYYIGY